MALNLKGGIALKQYRNSILKELVRKSIHMCSSFVPFFLGIAYEPVIVLLCALLVFYCVSELLRLKGVELPVVAKILLGIETTPLSILSSTIRSRIFLGIPVPAVRNPVLIAAPPTMPMR